MPYEYPFIVYSKIKMAFVIDQGEKPCDEIALGHGKTQGFPHKSKAVQEVTKVEGELPAWFKKGAECALLAPTAMNQQKFLLTLNGDMVSAKAGMGFYAMVDLGIV